jgi:hypothetical protein
VSDPACALVEEGADWEGDREEHRGRREERRESTTRPGGREVRSWRQRVAEAAGGDCRGGGGSRVWGGKGGFYIDRWAILGCQNSRSMPPVCHGCRGLGVRWRWDHGCGGRPG